MEARSALKPGLLVVMVWIVVLVLTAYGPQVVRDELEKSEALSDQPALQAALDSIARLGELVGLDRLEAALSAGRAAINAPYTVLVREEAAPPGDEPPVEPPPVERSDDDDALAHISPKRPRRVLVVGASSIQFAIGVEFERRLPTYAGVKVKRFGQLATGLSRPDFFDWPAKLESLAAAFKPDLVICNFGGNGAQAIPVAGGPKVPFRTPQWDALYAERVTQMIDIARKHGAETVFLGMPTMRKKDFTRKMQYLNGVQARALDAAGMLFVSTFEMAANPDGTYRKTVTYRGKRGLMRTSDGVHYRKLGARFIVEQVMQAIERKYRLVSPDESLAIAEGHAFLSKVASSTVGYTAYVPREGSAEGARAALLLPAEGEDWFTWPNHPHRTLQAVAAEQGVVLLVPEDARSAARLKALDAPLLEELERDARAHLRVSELLRLVGVTRTALKASVQDRFAKAAPSGEAAPVDEAAPSGEAAPGARED